ncbi:hypothetical protein CSV71_08030 [Sporosarcina sp. P21c]|uniref:hypothetical protein n=1 Tax=unclassified Sporosarcina TaxID=2647733 RepID=UPI000C16B4EA|nr:MULTISPECIES: hypothetical protein [unclassified Sporosarcina]PIC66752.1 hypothetical protein CSV78_11250 [Sporosarcina sp. P16a]PIC89887.1 hypothetical protein CSV71_08030 [Sporosarcina sp. P21c]PIC93273.1 hypothetical protein CSV70_06845 [Sporosarcina sp. P25]
MNESIIGLLVAAVTIFITNIFSYIFAMKKEVRIQSTNYKIEILDKVYTPIYKILIQDVVPGDGYESIDDHQLESILKIAAENINLVDPKLDNILWKLREEVRYAERETQYNGFIYLDEDRMLLYHIESYYNKLRKAIGLPYEKHLNRKLILLSDLYYSTGRKFRRKIRKRLGVK